MFHNWNKTEWIHRLILLILPLLFVALMLSQNDIYGSLTDWLSQHITFPDYFRMIFQETGQLFPDFSLNLGGGQNFAQYTYYGLLRPDFQQEKAEDGKSHSTDIAENKIHTVFSSKKRKQDFLCRRIHA